MSQQNLRTSLWAIVRPATYTRTFLHQITRQWGGVRWNLCAHRIAEADGYDRQVIVMCSEGYTSSLAAASLQDLGLHRAADLVGGFKAWAAAGLPAETA
jgi:rhodanese-related sulfurtransferase